MERELKLSMAVPMSTRYGGSQAQKSSKGSLSRQKIIMICLTVFVLVLTTFVFKVGRSRSPQAMILENLPSASLLDSSVSAQSVNPNNEGNASNRGLEVPAALLQQESTESQAQDSETPAEASGHQEDASEPVPNILAQPTQAQLQAYAENAPVTYYAQSGDSLGVLAVRFGVEISDIRSMSDITPNQLIPEGHVLFIPNRLGETTPTQKVFPDSEVVNSPSAIAFDTKAFVDQAGGYLSTLTESVYGHSTLTGAEIVDKVAREYGIHPRLLLALIEFKSGWVFGYPVTQTQKAFPLGIMSMDKPGLHHQLVQVAGILGTGYYGWREGHTVILSFKDGTTLRLAAELNAGSVALMHFFAWQNTMENWQEQVYGDNRFAKTYERMFDDPWRIASQVEPLISADVEQPELILPFAEGVTWTMTVGPHAAWGAVDVRAALDFSPPKVAPGCDRNYSWITSASTGYVVRSEDGTVVVDLDGDGYEQTGWVIVYMHVATENRVEVGTWLSPGQRIGHPSCEGGISTGSHLHIARKYNGEWVPADGPMPFVMSGWRAVMDPISLGGWLVKGEEMVQANLYGVASSQISR